MGPWINTYMNHDGRYMGRMTESYSQLCPMFTSVHPMDWGLASRVFGVQFPFFSFSTRPYGRLLVLHHGCSVASWCSQMSRVESLDMNLITLGSESDESLFSQIRLAILNAGDTV